MIVLVPCDSNVTVRAHGHLIHQCPYKDETDHGEVTITWTVAGKTIELHSLYEYLAGWRSAQLSHEQVTDRITRDLSTLEGITGVTVHTMWETAGMQVSVTSGRASCDLLREPDRSQDREASHA